MKRLLIILSLLAPRLLFADGAKGLTTSASVWMQSSATNVSLSFNGTIQTFTLPATNVVNFSSFSGSSGSISFLIVNTPVTYNTNGLRWLTAQPNHVTNGIVSFTAYGTNVIAAYKECQ